MTEHIHNGTCYETPHLRFFVRCEICRKWRLRRRGYLFWKVTHWYADLRPGMNHTWHRLRRKKRG